MPEQRGGFLIRFDEEQRVSFLQDIRGIEDGFSDALSSSDWPVKQWEVCGLLFEAEAVTHWALARKGKKVATGKVRVEFSYVTPHRVTLEEIERRIGRRLAHNMVRARTGVGGKVPPATWSNMKEALRAIDPSCFEIVERLERLRDQSVRPINRPGVENVAQQRDAVGLALDVFDKTGVLRKKTLSAWTAPDDDRLTSFLEGLHGVRTIEDQLIARDAVVFPGSGKVKHTVMGAVFGFGGRTLEVFNVNRSAIETALGVDLIYFNEEFDAWTLIQYKAMERSTDALSGYRPDASFDKELGRMRTFRTSTPDQWQTGDGIGRYRLCGDGFYFKLCSRVQLEVLSESLLPGMYLPREFVEELLAGQMAAGPRGGRIITFENTSRHINNTVFAELVRDGWIGTRGISSAKIADIIRDKLTAGQAIVIGRSRPARDRPDLQATLSELKLGGSWEE